MATSTALHSRSTNSSGTSSSTGTKASTALSLPDLDPSAFADPDEVRRIQKAQMELFEEARKQLWRKLEERSSVDPVEAAQEYAQALAKSKQFYEREIERLLNKERQLKDLDHVPKELFDEQMAILNQIEKRNRSNFQTNAGPSAKNLSSMSSSSVASSASTARFYPRTQTTRLNVSVSATPATPSSSTSYPRTSPPVMAHLEEEEESGSATSGDSTSASDSEDYGLDILTSSNTMSSVVSPGSTPPTPQSIGASARKSPTKTGSRSPRLSNSPPPSPSFYRPPSPYSFNTSRFSYSNTHKNRAPSPPPPAPPTPPPMPPAPGVNTPPLWKLRTNPLGGRPSPTMSPISPTFASFLEKEREREREDKKESIYNPAPNDIWKGNWTQADFEDISERNNRPNVTEHVTSPNRRTSFGSASSGIQHGRRPSLFGEPPMVGGRSNWERRGSFSTSSTTSTPTSATFPRKPSPPNSTNGTSLTQNGTGNGTSSASQQTHTTSSKPSLAQQYWSVHPSSPSQPYNQSQSSSRTKSPDRNHWTPNGSSTSSNGWSARMDASSASGGSIPAPDSTSGSKPVPLTSSASFSSPTATNFSSINTSSSASSASSSSSGTSSRTSFSSSSGYYPKTHPSAHHSSSSSSSTSSAAINGAKVSNLTTPLSHSSATGGTGVNGSSTSTASSAAQTQSRRIPIPHRSQTMPISSSNYTSSRASNGTPPPINHSENPFERLAREHYEQEAKYRASSSASGAGHKASFASLRSSSGGIPTPNRSNSMGSTASGGGFVPTPPPGMGPSTNSTSGAGQRSTSSTSSRPGTSSNTGSSSSKKGHIEYNDDLYAKLKEEEERFRARKLAASVNSASSDPGMKTRMTDAYGRYEEKWAALGSLSKVRFGDIPWPVYTSALTTPSSVYSALAQQNGPKAPKPVTSIEQLTTTTIAAFILSPFHSEGKSRKDRIKAELLRWHPDRFNGRYLSKVNGVVPPDAEESERDRVRNCVGQVARCLSDMLTMSDVFAD